MEGDTVKSSPQSKMFPCTVIDLFRNGFVPVSVDERFSGCSPLLLGYLVTLDNYYGI
jgi:hypothetical protein